jgi:uncharacterized phage protein (TIGR02216 family)
MSKAEASPFPWEDVTAFCLGRLRWSPNDFWSATPRELASAIRGYHGIAAGDATGPPDIAGLMRLFPDG